MTNDPWIKKFKAEALPIIKKRLKPDKIILFGSRVKGEAMEGSDIDVIIISDEFKGIPFVLRMSMVLKLINFPKHVDIICYTPDEFHRMKDKSSLLIDALEKNMIIS
ncbi:MAG: nucleotidyltransferase domain-containing protein [Candidatus Helarchaeota archaeon]